MMDFGFKEGTFPPSSSSPSSFDTSSNAVFPNIVHIPSPTSSFINTTPKYTTTINLLSLNPLPISQQETMPMYSNMAPPTIDMAQAESMATNSSSQIGHLSIRQSIKNLMSHIHSNFSDLLFAERVIANILRRISLKSPNSDQGDWERAVALRSGECVRILRPKDGRLTITKSTVSGGTRKIYPQIIVCQMFRWPEIVYHHDIMSSAECKCQHSVKPTAPPSLQGGQEFICVNPFHFVLSKESNQRLNYKVPKFEKVNSEMSPPMVSVTYSEQNSPLKSPHMVTPKTIVVEPCQTALTQTETMIDEISPDYAKLWDNSAPALKLEKPETFKELDLLSEIEFLCLKKNNHPISADSNVVDKMGLWQQIKSELISGQFVQQLNKSTPADTVSLEKTTSTDLKSNTSIHNGMELDVDACAQPTVVLHPIHDNNTSELNQDDALEECISIQNLLDDIRGSFERQFDDGLTAIDPALNEIDGSSYSHMLGGVDIATLGTVRSSAFDSMFAGTSAEMASLSESTWSVQGGVTPADVFMQSESISHDEIDSLLCDMPIAGAPSSIHDQTHFQTPSSVFEENSGSSNMSTCYQRRRISDNFQQF